MWRRMELSGSGSSVVPTLCAPSTDSIASGLRASDPNPASEFCAAAAARRGQRRVVRSTVEVLRGFEELRGAKRSSEEL